MKRKVTTFLVVATLCTGVAGCVASTSGARPGAAAAPRYELSELQGRTVALDGMTSVGIGSLAGGGPGPSALQRRAAAEAGMASIGIGSLSGLGPGATGR